MAGSLAPQRIALRMRGPARRCAGSVPTAAATCAVLVGIYDIVIGGHYIKEASHYYRSEGLIFIAAYTALASSCVDIFLLFGVFRKKEEYLHSIVSAGLAVYIFFAPLSPICIICLACDGRWLLTLWEIPRILLYPLHACLLYCLLCEIRGEVEQPQQEETAPEMAAPSPELPGDNWLRSNIAQAGHGVLGVGDAPLKVQVHAPAPAPPPPSGPQSSTEA